MIANESVPEIVNRLRRRVDSAVKRNLADCILLSGGLDTSIITAAASKYNKLTGVTVSLGDAPDVKFADMIAEKFQVEHVTARVDYDDIELAIADVVKVMRSFDPMEIRNDASILIGLQSAKRAGFGEVITGDAADELFAG